MRIHNTDTRKLKALAYYADRNIPVNPARLFLLAKRYEAAYRRHRASKRPPSRQYLAGELLTARAFYSLARDFGITVNQ